MTIMTQRNRGSSTKTKTTSLLTKPKQHQYQPEKMDLMKLIEKIRKEHLYVQDERQSIHQLNIDVNEKIDLTIKSMWIIKNQRYICDKLHVGHIKNDPINLINESNKIQQAEFLMGHQKFGSNEVFLSNVLQHLKENPKSISYLLFHAEKEVTNFLDLLCKIIISTVYNHCFLDQDKLSLIDLMEELIEIYINFHDDLRLHLHSKHSSFGIIYRYFCDELLELKTFYKLALTKPIMLLLSEDNLFLDIDPNRTVMRFRPEERLQHFGPESSPEYQEKLKNYSKWIISKLKVFINQFIKSLRENIYAFPQSLILLMIRMYAKLIERFEYQKVIAIFVDLIFFFLLCPAIQNPDLFGITDLHVNHISHYNLMQCAQIIQMLAMANWEKINKPYQEICDQFDRNCLTFIVEHIFSVAKSAMPKTIDPMLKFSHYYISDIELKFLLEYLSLFLNQNESDDQLNNLFRKLPDSIMNFEYENPKQAKSNEQQPGGRVVKKIINLSRSNDFTENCLNEFSSLNIKHLLANNVENWPSLKALFNAKRIYKITNYEFQQRFIGLKSEEKILNSVAHKQGMMADNVEKVLEEIDECFNLEIQQQVSCYERIEEMTNKMASFCCLINSEPNKKDSDILTNIGESLIGMDGGDLQERNNFPGFASMNTDEDCESFAQMNMQSLGTLHLGDFIIDDHLDDSPLQRSLNQQQIGSLQESSSSSSKQQMTANNPLLGKKVMTGLKSFKDKMKQISLNTTKDINKSKHVNNPTNEMKIQYSNDVINIDCNVDDSSQKLIDFETVKAETDEIFGKYRSDAVISVDSPQNLINFGNETNEQSQLDDETKNDPLFDIRGKLRKLLRTIDIAYVHRNYHFLDLSEKNEFVKFLQILLSHCDDSRDLSTTVLIIEIIRVLENLSQSEYSQTFQQIKDDWKIRNIYTIYLLKSRQYLLQKLQQFQSVDLSLRKEQSSTDFIIISFLVRMVLEQQEQRIRDLITKFNNPTTLTDEKASMVKMVINDTINNHLRTVNFTENQLTLVKQILERHLISHIYLLAFYPNGDIDYMRDQILHKQIQQLSSSLSHNSKLLNIPSKYFNTSPWPSAQQELRNLCSYKTPRDKVQCIFRCCSHIITLLGTCQNSIPSADDLLPVLIFVVIKANPKSILSTIQYVHTFYLNEMTGEESYYWTLFCSAVEFIKTILNETST